LRYAHLYYRDDEEGIGGLEFPCEAAPSYFDFAYFSFTVGMCFQVSDVVVSEPADPPGGAGPGDPGLHLQHHHRGPGADPGVQPAQLS
jgi:hypothetical protein